MLIIPLVLNARIRRIDLLCKLLGPLTISLIAGASTVIAIWAVLGMNLGPLLVEYLCIAQVLRNHSHLDDREADLDP